MLASTDKSAYREISIPGDEHMQRTLDYSATWNDAMALLKAHREAAIAVAGVFLLLPLLFFGYILPSEPVVPGTTGEAALKQLMDMLSAIAPWLIGMSILALIGKLAIFHMILDADTPTVAEGLMRSGQSIFTVLLARLIAALAIVIGTFLLIVPGIYFSIKFSQIETVVVAEKIGNPLDALSRSWAVTKGNSIQIFGFLLIIGIVSILSFFVISVILGLGLTLVLPDTIAQFVIMVISSVLQMLLGLLMIFVYSAIYRQLSPS
jgi:hypothetical protein